MVAHACHPCPWVAEAGKSEVHSHSCLHRGIEADLSCETLCEHKHMNAEDVPTIIPGTDQDIAMGGAKLGEGTSATPGDRLLASRRGDKMRLNTGLTM